MLWHGDQPGDSMEGAKIKPWVNRSALGGTAEEVQEFDSAVSF